MSAPFGIYDYPDPKYREFDGANASMLWQLINRTPAHSQILFETTSAMAIGTATHWAILEPAAFEISVVRGPENRRGKQWKEFVAIHEDQLVLTEKDYDKVLAMRDAVYAVPEAVNLIKANDSQAEQSLIWEDEETGLQCKAKSDLVRAPSRLQVDLKTSADAGEFGKSCASWGYHLQCEHYRSGLEAITGDPCDFVFLVVEKDSNLVAMYRLDEEAQAEGRAARRAALALYKQCRDEGVFPGYPSTIQPVSLPGWAIRHKRKLI